MRVLERFRLWLRSWRLRQKLSAVEARCLIAEENKRRSLARLAAREAEISRLFEAVQVAKAAADKDLAQAKSAMAAYEEALNTVRAELRVASDVTVPALVAAHKLLLQRYDAEVAIETRRQVGASVRE